LRLLVVDSNQLLGWQLRHELPPEIELEVVGDFSAAERHLREAAPDAAVVSLPPAELPWRLFQRLCAAHRPPVPVLYESCLFASAEAAGLDSEDGYAAFLPKPATRSALSRALAELLSAAGAARQRSRHTGG